ncbi:triose-phosphate transporter family-domain-containing protein [Calycina marina]|uniref:Triose-phosphate transporter family-domain-containing protein n=1 Tax=Calycina marina TaxID=1763456 RepID=A0A9P7Z6R6_9HELO|nr:triose-phosphate transporter family-domain-containing protein [Calycina marina]
MNEEKVRLSGEMSRGVSSVLPTVNPSSEKTLAEKKAGGLPSVVYVMIWIFFSSSVILFNKWILATLEFPYPVLLTAWHLIFATILTQIMARFTTLLDGRKKQKMNGRIYMRAIVPIGAAFSLSLICGNLTYLYLSVSFIQMLKATTPVAVLITGGIMGTEEVSVQKFINVSAIVVGVVIASFGEIDFVLIGFLYQLGGIIFEAIRINLVSSLLNGQEKMDPLVSLYYFAPICAAMNFTLALFWEIPKVTSAEIHAVGLWTLLANAWVAFMLNVSVVFLIGKTSGLTLTLCGVLKDILLVCLSILIWGTLLSHLQVFGYSIALVGMLYFKTSADQRRELIGSATRSWAEFGSNRPILRKLFVLGLIGTTIYFVLSGLAPTYAPVMDPKKAYDAAKNAVAGAV